MTLPVETQDERVVIKLPATAPQSVAPVVVLELAAEPVAVPIASHGKPVCASGTSSKTSLGALTDGDLATFWEVQETERKAWLEIDLKRPITIHAFAIDEPDRWPRYQQVVRMEGDVDGNWQELCATKTRGHGCMQRIAPATITRARLHIEREAGPPGIRAFQLYAPE